MAAENRKPQVTINAAFLQEIKEVNEDLWRLLAAVAQVCGDPHLVSLRSRQVVDMLAQLRDQLAMHFALEEAYGYFNDPLHAHPRLTRLAGQLRDEHPQLYAAVRDLADDVDAWYRSGKLVERSTRVVQRFREYYDRLQEHEKRENELIMEVYDLDTAPGD
jgi:hemerythrin-like domain-containing protein